MEQTQTIPVIEEELVTGRREVPEGSVRVRKTVETVHKEVEASLLRDAVDVSRVAVNRVVDAIPELREEGDVLVIPVVEEEIVIRKRLVLREEIRVTRRRTKERVKQEISLDREVAVVEKLDAEGRVIGRSAPLHS
jgi:uncharacterized protein (TIGR02271 family)